MGLFDIFSAKKPDSMMDVFIRSVYGDPPPTKKAKVSLSGNKKSQPYQQPLAYAKQ